MRSLGGAIGARQKDSLKGHGYSLGKKALEQVSVDGWNQCANARYNNQ
jgi:hypothetical protein